MPHPVGWWRTAVVYEVYPRSFADSNGDGIGDLAGLRSRLDYLARLGIDAIWMTPFYPSPQADGGYDISDYRDIDPRLGTLEEFDALLAAAHALDIKVIIDIVPNHTSEQHPWFREALASPPGSTARNRYIFRDGLGPHGSKPPTDWRSHFGGSAWRRVADGQWYCHLFAREQPDLNWGDPDVRHYFLGTLRFWADRGVDGFRIDVAHGLAKDLSEPLRSQPHLDSRLPLDGSDPLYDRDEVHEIYRSWRRLFNQYDPPKMAVAELWLPSTQRTHLYARSDELGQVFDFNLVKAEWNRDRYRQVIVQSLRSHAGAGGDSPTWVLSSHDVPRHASRLGLPSGADPGEWLSNGGRTPAVDPDQALRRARAATLVMLALPGSAYLYQGEELGLPEVPDLPPHVLTDPVWKSGGRRLAGRDGCRVPLPWTRAGRSYGFSANGSWLPQPATWSELSVEAQEQDRGSTLSLYREALRHRHYLQPSDLQLTWIDTGDNELLHYKRSNGWQCAVNFSSHTAKPLPPGEVIVASSQLPDGSLPPETAAWLLT